MRSVWLDSQMAFRQFRRAPGFTFAVVATLAIGIGASSAMFTFVKGVLLAPVPYADDQDRVVIVGEPRPNGGRGSIALPDFFDWRARARTMTALGLFRSQEVNVAGGSEPLVVAGGLVTSGVFPALGVSPLRGRPFGEVDDLPGAPAVAILREDLWRQAFGGRAEIVGETILVDGAPHVVVGVMPRRYAFPSDGAQIWTALGAALGQNPSWLDRQDHLGFYAVGRLAPGAGIGAARGELEAITAALAAEHPTTNAPGVVVTSLYDDEVGGARTMLLVLFGAVGFLLLAACANVTALLLARGIRRSREIAVRAALGASRGRLVRQLVTESVLLALAGGLGSFFVAMWGVGGLIAIAPASVPRLSELHADAGVLAFTVGLSLAIGVGVGVLAAWHAATHGMRDLRPASAGGSAPTGHRAQSAVVVVQVSLALLLTVGAGLMLKSRARLQAVSPGIDPQDVTTARLRLPQARYRGPEERAAFARELVPRLEALPGVTAAGVAYPGPMGGSWQMGASVAPLAAGDPVPTFDHSPISPQLFRALGVPLLAGRPFAPADDATAPKVIVLSASAARRIFGGQDAVGRAVKLGGPRQLVGSAFGEGGTHLVVGVVADVRVRGLLRDSPGQIYVPYLQWTTPGMGVYLKSALPVDALARALRSEVARIDGALAVTDVAPIADVMGRSIMTQRFAAVVFAAFAGLALALAALGVYGLVAFLVAQRTREIGIRIALGATPRDVIALVTRRIGVLVGAGLVAGAAGALALHSVLRGLLAGTSPLDPVTFVVVPLLLCVVAAVACIPPMRRALAVDPVEAMRSS
jgi:predicted permease